MPSEFLIKSGTPKIWKASGGDAALTMAAVANSAGRQGVKLDMLDPRAREWLCRILVDYSVAPTARGVVEVWWAGSPNATAGTENPGGATGTDAAFTDEDLLLQLRFIGAISLDSSTDDQVQDVGIMIPHHRYGMPVIWNRSSQALNATEGNMFVGFYPVVDESQ